MRYTVNIEAPVSFDAPATRAEELSAGASFNWALMLLAVYGCGIVVISLRYWVGLRKIAGLLATQPVRKTGSFHIVDSPDLQHPFSIFRYIFINSRATSETAQMMILEHEQTHIRQLHWLDLATANMVCILQWFNPFVWLYVDSVKQNHEYLADRSVLQSGYSPAMYQTLLLSYALNIQASPLVHSFARAGKVNRFRMMKKTESNPLRKGAALMVLPALTVFLWAFAQPVYIFHRQNTAYESTITVTDTVFVPDDIIVSPRIEAFEKTKLLIANQSVKLELAKNEHLSQTEADDADMVKPEKLEPILPKTIHQLKVDDGITLLKQPEMQIPEVSVFNTELEANPPLIILNGAETPYSTMQTINPNDIQSITILKESSSFAIYGEAGKNGVILIHTKEQTDD